MHICSIIGQLTLGLIQLLATTLVSDQLYVVMSSTVKPRLKYNLSSELKRNNFFSRKAYFSARHQQLLGRLGNDNGDGNENGKKAIGLDKPNNNAFLYISLLSLRDNNVKLPIFTFCGGHGH